LKDSEANQVESLRHTSVNQIKQRISHPQRSLGDTFIPDSAGEQQAR